MIVQAGSFAHPTGTVEYTISRSPLRNEAQHLYAWRERWDLIIDVTRDMQGDYRRVDAAVRNVERAYSQDGIDLRVLLPNGRTSVHELLSRDCIGGTRVVMPTYPSNKGAEGVTKRSLQVAVEGDRALPNNELKSALLSFTETVRPQGGGPRFGHLELRRGRPHKQLETTHEVFTATQSGTAVGLYTYPAVPPPIWPFALKRIMQPQYDHPQRIGGNFIGWPVSWNYEYEANQVLRGATPHIWGITYLG